MNEHGNTPLHYACFWGYGQIAEDLITAGAHAAIANKYGETPLDKCKGLLPEKLHGKKNATLSVFFTSGRTIRNYTIRRLPLILKITTIFPRFFVPLPKVLHK